MAFLIRTAEEFTDQAIDMHDQMIGRLFNRSERRQQQGFQQNAKAINDKVRLYAEVGKALIAAYKAKTDLGEALESVLGWDQFATTVEEAERLVERSIAISSMKCGLNIRRFASTVRPS